jgi:two-component system chemotaxis response regulator CheB
VTDRRIRVLIVDDNPVFRLALQIALSSDPEIEIVGKAADGKEAVEMVAKVQPDVVTMDVLMPIMGGAETIRRVMTECPTPVVVFAAAQTDQRLAWQAMEYGAAEVFAKPTAGLDATTVGNLAAALRRAAKARVGIRSAQDSYGERKVRTQPRVAAATGVLGIVGSTGAPRVLQAILSALPASFPWPIAIVQHTLRGFADSLVTWLASYTDLKVAIARPGAQLRRGLVLVAPDNAHLEIQTAGRVFLSGAPTVEGHRPSATVLLRSLAASYGPRAAGLVLTGMGRDGCEGAAAIDAARGLVMVEEPATAMLASMPVETLNRVPHATREEAGRLGALLLELAGLKSR